jgi:hypothetical protein
MSFLRETSRIVRRRCSALALGLGLLFGSVGGASPALAGEVLVMVEQVGCYWCEAWDEEIGVVYAITDEGQRAPLRRIDLFDPMPDDITVRSKARFTPTFILLRDGVEVGRIEGYPGEDFFWPMLNQLLETSAQQQSG